MIKVIDIFAGPGGLGEGFSSIKNNVEKNLFKIVLSIEKENFAHKTLLLRSFFRQFPNMDVPDQYYKFLQNKISIEELFAAFPKQYSAASQEAWRCTLGQVDEDVLDEKIKNALQGKRNWVLIGGPPCQAYSLK